MQAKTDQARAEACRARAGENRAAQIAWATKAKQTGYELDRRMAEAHRMSADAAGALAAYYDRAAKPAQRPSLLRRLGEFFGVL
jgi:hypothetical protein